MELHLLGKKDRDNPSVRSLQCYKKNKFQTALFICCLFLWLLVQEAFAEQLRVISANIGAATLGRDYKRVCDNVNFCKMNPSIVLFKLIDFFKVHSPDRLSMWHIFALQEVDKHKNRSNNFNQAFIIDQGMGRWDGYNKYSGWANRFTATVSGTYGIAMVSNHSLKNSRDINLGCHLQENTGDKETRKAQFSKLHSVNIGVPFWVVNTHLSYTSSRAICQVKTLMSTISATIPVGDAVLIVGDLNIKKYSNDYYQMQSLFSGKGFVELNEYGITTFHAWDKIAVIDYAFLRDPGSNITGTKIQVVTPSIDINVQNKEFLSDHKFLIVDLEWNTSGIAPPLVPAISATIY